MGAVTKNIREDNEIAPQDINWLISHQANLRIIQAVKKSVGLCDNQIMSNISKYGNTSAGQYYFMFLEQREKIAGQ